MCFPKEAGLSLSGRWLSSSLILSKHPFTDVYFSSLWWLPAEVRPGHRIPDDVMGRSREGGLAEQVLQIQASALSTRY